MRRKNFLGFWDTNGSPNLGLINKLSDSQQKKRTFRIVDFAVPAHHNVKLKESEKSDKYLDLARELKKIYGTWKWQWYQLLLVRSVQLPKVW